jgi:hypothetical protein
MAYAVTDESHSSRWKKVMVRLREAGAPLCEADLSLRLGVEAASFPKNTFGPP